MRWLRILGYFLRRGFTLTLGSGRNFILGVVAITMALLLWGMALLLETNLSTAMSGLDSKTLARAYLEPGVASEERARLVSLVEGSVASTEVRYVDAASAMEQLSAAFPDFGDRAETEGEIVSAYIEWSWQESSSTELRSGLITELEQSPQVAWLDDDQAWRGRMGRTVDRLRLVGWVLAALTVLAAGFVTAAVVRLAAYKNEIEIEIERLSGATELYVRAPFLVAGMLQGLWAGAAATLLLYGFWRGARRLVGTSVLTDLVLGEFLGLWLLVAFLAVGVLAGTIGAILALRPRLH